MWLVVGKAAEEYAAAATNFGQLRLMLETVQPTSCSFHILTHPSHDSLLCYLGNATLPAALLGVYTRRLLSSSFLGLPYGVLNVNPKRNYLGACRYRVSLAAGRTSPVCSMRVRNVGSLLTQARHGHVGLKALQHAYLVMCRGYKNVRCCKSLVCRFTRLA